jgi:outer membrane lipoprotein-sorting protein
MKKRVLFCFFLLFLLVGLAACGEKSQEDVLKALDEKVQKMSGYKAEAKMTLQTGTEPQVYEIEIWHKSPSYYRVNLKNAERDQHQMILRNDEGVFVLTPALNKSFRFQSDWPQNSSQVYLYESLVKDILADSKAMFKATKDHYVFQTKTNYENKKMLPKQEIMLSKKDLSPVKVTVMDVDLNPLLTVEFAKVEWNANFDDNAFDVNKNMTRAQLDDANLATKEANQQAVPVMYPLYQLDGVELAEEKEFVTENGKRIIMTFTGEKSFTLVQEKAHALPTMSVSTSVSGEPVDLGFAVGALTEQSLTWSYKGVDFILASNDLTKEEMIAIARSVQGKVVK